MPIVEDYFVCVLQAARLRICTNSATSNPGPSVIHHIECTFFVSMGYHHLRQILYHAAQRDGERCLELALETQELVNACWRAGGLVGMFCAVWGSRSRMRTESRASFHCCAVCGVQHSDRCDAMAVECIALEIVYPQVRQFDVRRAGGFHCGVPCVNHGSP